MARGNGSVACNGASSLRRCGDVEMTTPRGAPRRASREESWATYCTKSKTDRSVPVVEVPLISSMWTPAHNVPGVLLAELLEGLLDLSLVRAVDRAIATGQ